MKMLRQIVLLILSVTGAWAADLTRYDFSGSGMSTTFRIACYAESRETAAKAVDACLQRVSYLNAIFTDYDPASELMKLCSPEAVYPKKVSRELFDLLKRSCELAGLTNGAFDPTCGHATHLWRRAKRLKKLPPADRLAQAVAATNWRRITLHPETQSITLVPGTLIDLGGIAKGYAADECLRILKQHGITRAVVLAGGDTSAGDPPPGEAGWEVTLHTGSTGDTTIRLANRCVSTSGDLYQFTEIDGVRYSHILSPKTGMGLTERIACSVIAPDGMTSDGLDTAFCVMGRQEGEKLAKSIPGIEVRFAE
jgi:FAD:protein FMN transferase